MYLSHNKKLYILNDSIFPTSFSLQLILLLFSDFSEDWLNFSPLRYPKYKTILQKLTQQSQGVFWLPAAWCSSSAHTLLLTLVMPEATLLHTLSSFLLHYYISIFSLSHRVSKFPQMHYLFSDSFRLHLIRWTSPTQVSYSAMSSVTFINIM